MSDTEPAETIDDKYSEKSKKGEVCGIHGCKQKPTSQCLQCFGIIAMNIHNYIFILL
jgi:hypothetical protein